MVYRGEKGFTLVELAIVLVIFGFLVTIATGAFVMTTGNRGADVTKESMKVSRTALMEFLLRFDRYPCPADPALGPGNPNFGREVCGPPLGGVTLTTAGARDADGVGGPDEVLIGSIPFATMLDPDGNPATEDGITQAYNFAEVYTVDGWGSKLGYAVTRKLTAPATYRDDYGAIDVEDENQRSLVTPPKTAHYVMFSYGENARGAHDKSGAAVSLCPGSLIPTPPPSPMPVTTSVNELENCNNNAIFLSGLINKSQYSYNDDILLFQTTQVTQLWNMIGGYKDPNWGGPVAAAPDILQAVNMNTGDVGIQTNTPAQKLDVNGDVLSTGRMRVNRFCPRNGNTSLCMEPEVLGGSDPNMTCSAGKVITSIDHNQVHCANVVGGGSPRNKSCPAGEFIVGITNLGNLVCGNIYVPPP